MTPFLLLPRPEWWQGVLDVLCPQQCLLCKTYVVSTDSAYPYCAVCAKVVTFVPLLSSVRQYPHYSLGYYDGALSEVLHAFKLKGRRDIGTYVAEVLYETWAPKDVFCDVDVLCPVPISRQRLWQRGFNQSDILARRLSELTHIPSYSQWLIKHRNTEPQMDLDREERAINVRGAYRVGSKKPEAVQTVLMIDDVLTTGHTVIECIRTLRRGEPRPQHFKVMTAAKA